MKYISLILVVAMLLVLPTMAKADITLTVSATVTSGTSLGSHTLLRCVGYSYDPAGSPWTQCTDLATGTSMNFGTLTTRLRNPDGSDAGGADCFYGTDFYIVYLFPDAWGGKGYELKQNAGTFTAQIANSVVMAPTYSADDSYGSGEPAQGDLLGTETLGSAVLAKNGGLILKSKRPRIVRAEYGIPPLPGTGDTRPAGWQKIPLTTPAGSYTGSVTITITEWQ